MKVRCTNSSLIVELETSEPFHGRIYSSGFSDTCGIQGNGNNLTILSLPMPKMDDLISSNVNCGLTPAYSISNDNQYAWIKISYIAIIEELQQEMNFSLTSFLTHWKKSFAGSRKKFYCYLCNKIVLLCLFAGLTTFFCWPNEILLLASQNLLEKNSFCALKVSIVMKSQLIIYLIIIGIHIHFKIIFSVEFH